MSSYPPATWDTVYFTTNPMQGRGRTYLTLVRDSHAVVVAERSWAGMWLGEFRDVEPYLLGTVGAVGAGRAIMETQGGMGPGLREGHA